MANPHKCDATNDLLMMTSARDLLMNVCIDLGEYLAGNMLDFCSDGSCPLCLARKRLYEAGLMPPRYNYLQRAKDGQD